jgi:hypothetical protein
MRGQAVAAATATASMLIAVLAGQSTAPRTAEGRPDLQGIWDYSTMTPLERPTGLARKKFFTKAEAAAYEKGAAARDFTDLPKLEQQVHADLIGDLATVEHGTLDPSRRTSLIVTPSNGSIPLTPKAAARRAARRKARNLPPDGPEALPLSDRCLNDVAGPPLIPTSYNNIMQIVQTPDYVMIESEMVHDARIIPLDARPHLPRTIREWNGDSRGWWEGDTLVIDTTNFRNVNALGTATAALHVTERLALVDGRSLLYEFTVRDRAAYTRPWSGAFTIHRTEARLYEFACHEGNYSIVGMLKGARAQERK